MLRNYFYIAWRSIKKDKVFSLLNVTGLAVGIACFLVLFLFIQDELSFDRFKATYAPEQIYRVLVRSYISGTEQTNSKTPEALGPVLAQNFPEVLSYARIGYYGPRAFRYQDKLFRSGSIYAVDSTFFDVFALTFVEGDPKTALKEPNTIVLTEKASKRIFGNENPIGKILPTENGTNFLVTALIKDFPRNTHFRCDYLESLSTYDVNQNWLDLWFTTYLVLKKGVNPAAFEKKLVKIVTEYVGPDAETVLGVPIEEFLKDGNKYGFYLQPFSTIYLHSQRDYGVDPNTEWGNVQMSDIAYTYIFSAVAIFILLIAVINFMNLATAKSEKRAKEVGVRKTFGSGRFSLIAQFTGEAIAMSFAAMIIAIVLLTLLLPLFNNLVERDLKFVLVNNFYTAPILVGFIVLVGILAGSYPAFYLSSFPPSKVLKSNVSHEGGGSMMRSTLVIVQFAISISLLIGTLIIKDQLDYIQKKNLGFNKEQLISVNNAAQLGRNRDVFKEELSRNPKVLSCSYASLMFTAGIPGTGYLYNKKSGTDPTLCQFLDVDYDFLETFQISMQSGRFFSRAFSTDDMAVVVNEAAAEMFTTDDSVGKDITNLDARDAGSTYKIIGVVKNFNYESLHTEVRPLVLHLHSPRQAATILTARISPDAVRNTVSDMEKTWKKYAPEGEAMNFHFVDETLSRMYNADEKTKKVSVVFSSLAIFIACIGLFGLAAFVTQQRTKEIGIRKVLGASTIEIVVILSKEFAFWVLMANVIAWPVAYFVMKNWLQNFAFRIDMGWSVFILSGITTLFIAISTVALHTVRAARANPVKSLKYE
jgi:putative ABC transport system permease protein